jgi:hypothetical protein
MADTVTDQGTQYAAFIDAELEREIARRESANTRAGAALTRATGLVTLVLALFAIFLGKDSLVTGWAKGFIAGAVVVLLAAGACAVVAIRPQPEDVVGTETLRTLLTDHWTDTETSARNQTARMVVDRIDELRSVTTAKGKWLLAAAILQLVAVGALATSTLIVVVTT